MDVSVRPRGPKFISNIIQMPLQIKIKINAKMNEPCVLILYTNEQIDVHKDSNKIKTDIGIS